MAIAASSATARLACPRLRCCRRVSRTRRSSIWVTAAAVRCSAERSPAGARRACSATATRVMRSRCRPRSPARSRLVAMRHIRLVVEYDGSQLHGWQRQHGQATVQQHLEEALAKLLTHEAPVVGASRTDAGVHARGQVASFRTERPIPVHGIRRGLNSLLPDTIAIRDAAEVPDDFHPRFSATGKHYRYTILVRPDRSPRWRDRAWHHPDPLSVHLMHDAARALVGQHDFAAFRSAGCSARTTVRRVDSITLTRLHPHLLEIDIRGNAFLRQ